MDLQTITLLLVSVACCVLARWVYTGRKENAGLKMLNSGLRNKNDSLQRTIERMRGMPVHYQPPERSTPSVEAFAEEARAKVNAQRRWSDETNAVKAPLTNWPDHWDHL